MYQLFLKKYSNIYIFLCLFLLTSCLSFKEEYNQIDIKKYECNISHQKVLDKDFLSINDKKFDKGLKIVNEIVNNGTKFNFIFSPGSRSSSGYNLSFSSYSLNNKNLSIFFKEKKPKKNTIVATVITYPFCALLIENIEFYNISVEII